MISDHIPKQADPEATTILDKVADAAFRSSPVSLIDLRRAAATTVLEHWLEATRDALSSALHLDLGDQLKAFEKQQGNGNTQSPLAAG
ncbi:MULTISPECIES: hypothetical protein [Betaproteobacteria]|uniref:hypothetical protein n=1 Tax=Betaproteobacteria TaxID=28216 RepID=UPI0011D7545C|nr:hypothetical protein [Zoogloea sp.]MDD3355126.1 hypothetical protein [Zoogloea sp.]TXH35422.1 MAG: hypothetical protein E6Q92_11950 [Burkholderiaceae bacterium]